jgi:hemolysin-activating ACP:hemolysin acyltransferase
MAQNIVFPQSVDMAVGAAAILLSSEPAYFDQELSLVVMRLLAAAEARQVYFLQDVESRSLKGFVSFGFFNPRDAHAWRHRLRNPSTNDIQQKTGECWLLDYSYDTADGFKLLMSEIRRRFPETAQTVNFHGRRVSYPTFEVGAFTGQ